jgi:hypothetical protein
MIPSGSLWHRRMKAICVIAAEPCKRERAVLA